MTARPSPTARRAAPLPTVLLARATLPQDAAAAVRSGRWVRVTRGAYLPVERAHRLDQRTAALGRIVGVHERSTAAHWFSHLSAALIWDLPVWTVPAVTHVTQIARPSVRGDRAVLRHCAELPEDQRSEIGGLPVTSLTRTVVDCARSCSPLEGLVIADAALRAGADPEEIGKLLAGLGGRRGVVRARTVVELADGGAESPGETATRFVVLRHGLPRPQTQLRVATRLGDFWADLGWEQWRLLLEYDGRPKYAERGAEAVVAEKRRHDAIVEAGYRMLRVTREDLAVRGQLVRRVLARIDGPVRLEARPALGRPVHAPGS